MNSFKLVQMPKKRVLLQKLCERHSECNLSCQLFQQFQENNVSIRMLYRMHDQKDIKSYAECSQQLLKLYQKRNLLIKRRKKFRRKNNIIAKNELSAELVQRLRQAVQILKSKNYTTNAIAASLGQTIGTILYINENQDFEFQMENYFNLNQIHIGWIKRYISQHQAQELQQSILIYKDFLQHFTLSECSLSLRKFQTILKRNCEASFRLPTKKDYRTQEAQSIDLRFNYTLNFLSGCIENYHSIFLDETSLKHTSKLVKCWQLKKQQKYRIIGKTNINLSILGALGQDGFISYQVIRGNVNKLIRTLRNKFQDEEFQLILDNSPIHKSKRVKRVLSAVRHLFLPPYSPQLNPIEKIWQSLKKYIHKEGLLCSNNLNCRLHQFFNELESQELQRYCFSILPFLGKSLEKQIY